MLETIKETGQIDLRDIQEDMYVENGEVKIQNIQTAEAYELQKELSNSDNLNDRTYDERRYGTRRDWLYDS